MLRRLHQWLGVLLAAYVLVAAASGFLLLWADDYVSWRYSDVIGDKPSITPDAAVIDTIATTLGNELSTLGMPTRARPVYQAWLDDGREAIFHPDTGALIAPWTWTDSLPVFLFELHAYLLAGDAGHTLVGILGMLLLAGMVSGLVLRIRNRRIFRLRYAIPQSTSRKHLLRGHAAQGYVTFALLAVLVFSGIALVFPGPVQLAFSGILGASGPQKVSVAALDSEPARIDYAAALRTARTELPDATLRFITPPREPGAPLLLRLRTPAELHPNGRSYVSVVPETGRLLDAVDARRRGLGPAAFDALYPLHAGKTGWPGYRLIIAIVSLSLLYIAASGSYLFLKRPRQSRRARRAIDDTAIMSAGSRRGENA